jgi:hypothetical protein
VVFDCLQRDWRRLKWAEYGTMALFIRRSRVDALESGSPEAAQVLWFERHDGSARLLTGVGLSSSRPCRSTA